MIESPSKGKSLIEDAWMRSVIAGRDGRADTGCGAGTASNEEAGELLHDIARAEAVELCGRELRNA